MIQGIDVSHWQDDQSTPQKMDFSKAVKMGAKFAFIKVSERGAIDKCFEYNWQAAKDAGLYRGGYHFLRWDLSGLVQARIFCDILGDDPGELPPAADFEAPNKGSLYPSNALLEQFMIEVENRTRRRCMLYTSPNYWNTHGRNKVTKTFDPKWAYYPLWVAHYFKSYQPGVTQPADMQPWKDAGRSWTFWQYTASGDGLAYGAESKEIDLNWFNGGLDELKALVAATAGGQPSAPTTPSTPTVPDVTPGKPVDVTALKAKISQAIDDWAKTLNTK